MRAEWAGDNGAEDGTQLIRPDLSRLPNDKERAALQRRRKRLAAMEQTQTVREACEQLQRLARFGSAGPLEEVRIRHGFVRLDVPTAPDISDRSAPPPEHRPPSTRLISPNGIALRLYLMALLEAQSRAQPGGKVLGTSTRLRRDTGSDVGWCDYIATTATASGAGRHRMGVLDKKQRQLQKTLDRLEFEHLVELPNRDAKRDQYDGFILMSDDGLRGRTNVYYRVPEHEGTYFTVPVTLFTNGWIYVLEDSELALLLLAARLRHKHGDGVHHLSAGPRLLNYGLSRDALEAHSVLDWLRLLEVDNDPERDFDGRVHDYRTRGAQPLGLGFLPDGLEQEALPAVAKEIQRRLDR